MNISSQFSVITIVNGRQRHLHNMLVGIMQSTIKPDEIIIIGINESPKIADELHDHLQVNVCLLEDSGNHLPIAKARNFGASKASYPHLVFLDVDCIPSEAFFEQILVQGIANNTLIMANPRYLENRLEKKFKVNELEELSIHHPHRPIINGLMTARDYMLFWSLAFYIPKTLFQKLEGFDESYTGYGGEDTDLSLKLRALSGPKLLLSEATVYHQQHPVYSPPVQQLEAIVQNTEIFYKKWNFWLMDNWLAEFKTMGLISWKPEGCDIGKIKEPSEALLEDCFKPDAPFM